MTNEIITEQEIKKLLSYLEFFQDSSSVFFTEVNGYYQESDDVHRFREALNETGFLLVFDWTTLLHDNEVYKDINHDIQGQIRNADLETLRKLMTSYIRGDRFNEGLFISTIVNGHITNILLRLKELV
ncbi:DUF6508 domain-containing protein [Paenibacillus motobuensis]|uniref:DUF6508 domain-containing protein n=1 Tax=Paenibacillus TaxID=44249 RepID=UPI00203BD0FC|nr:MULTISPECIES: DUF6508 domain-containing protein [Paenibacillus]MCM3038678.1 DUF6508 domain-containing protein [Paenibacillus lutimineralis]MCM3645782.1 DUF6508 domain-containing protein [Paenibacillus motobuensis]